MNTLGLLGWTREEVERRLAGVGKALAAVYRMADAGGNSTAEAAERLAAERLAAMARKSHNSSDETEVGGDLRVRRARHSGRREPFRGAGRAPRLLQIPAKPAATGGRAMKLLLSVIAALCAATLVVPAALADSSPVYYVALGDSLATGAQPAPSGELGGLNAANGTNRGYVDDLYAAERAKIPNLQLRNFGCGGETTRSMINGGFVDVVCGYVNSSQLVEAVAFLQTHPGQIAFVTIDIGANDLLSGGGVPAIAANLPVILDRLRHAVGAGVPIVGMNYYDPFLAPLWFGTHDLTALQGEVANDIALDGFFDSVYAAAGDPDADLLDAFSTTDLTIQPDGLPLDVERICQWTWMCAVGNIHANDAGYAAIAQAFEQVLP
jgi:lysophospholipase L1-like esterase